MDSNLIDPQNRQKFHQLIYENYDIAVNKSIQDLLHSHNRDCSAFASAFYELMQARANPPLETIWVYSALTFRCSISLNDEPSNRVSATRDLFQLISSCSASSSSSKSIILLGPVLCEVCRVIVDLKGETLKRERKLMREIRSLVNSILGYISVCCSENDGDGGLRSGSGLDFGSDLDDFVWPIEDLIRVWIGDEVDKTSQPTEVFKFFFPLLGDEIVRRLSVEGSGVSELAGVVISEAFLLKLCLDSVSEDFKLELQKDLSTWAVGSITGIRNFYFVG